MPHGHWNSTTFVGALRTSGMTAPMVIDGAMHGHVRPVSRRSSCQPSGPATLSSWTTCQPISPSPCASPSNTPALQLCFLPAYSPDFNPIEMAFAKLKAFLKKHAPRTVTELWDTMARAIDAFSPAGRVNDIAAAGYDHE